MKVKKKNLLPILRPAQPSPSFCKRLARINNIYAIFLLLVLYVIFYLRYVDVPKQIPIPDWVLSSLHPTNVTDPESMTQQSNPEILINLQSETHTESKIACKIPQLDPFHKNVKPFLREVQDPPKCREKYPPIFKLGLNFIVIRENNSTEWKACCYRVISGIHSSTDDVDTLITYSQDCVPMSEEVTHIPAETEFIGVYCTIPLGQKESLNITSTANTKQLVDAFAFIPVKAAQNMTISDSQYDLDHNLNVLIYGIDGVSRMNFLRTMPKIHKFLTKNLSAISMESYVKVADNTYPNLMAVLTAMNASNTHESCGKNKFFDDCPLLWKKFAEKGYKTSFAEDAPWMGIFNPVNRGFKLPSVDYYLRPIAHVLDEKLGSDKRGICNVCNGPRLAIEVLLNYIQKTALAMNQRNNRYFQFIWSSTLTHNYLNLGRLGENVTLETLQWFHKEGHLNKTVLILMSDHGIRYGPFRKTKQGQIEENLPFLYFVFPEWFKKKYPSAVENMKKNANRLTTPFDLHETLLDILNPMNLEESKTNHRKLFLDSQRLKNEIPRGISMFLPSPPERTCEIASIPENYCACHKLENMMVNSSLAQQAANFAVYKLNSLAFEYVQCAFLTLQNVTSARMLDMALATNQVKQVVKISFVTSPGDAEFEVTVVRHLQNTTNKSWSLSEVSRINFYGEESHCVSDKIMKKYCYCNNLLRK